jgi:hypothetical protein
MTNLREEIASEYLFKLFNKAVDYFIGNKPYSHIFGMIPNEREYIYKITDEILKLIEKRIDMIKNYEENYDSHEKYVIEHFVKELLKE